MITKTRLIDVVATLRPWRRRLTAFTVTWLVFVVGARLLDLAPSVPVLFVIVLGGFSVSWFLIDHTAANRLTAWPLIDGHLGARSRGNDFRVTSLATRLQAANTRSEGREALVDDLHQQLSTIVRERLFAKHGILIEDEPRWSEGVMPPPLWQFVTSPPPTDLFRPATLDGILKRIEQW